MSCDCILIGRAVKDCKEIVTATGKVMYAFPVASSRGFGEHRETDYFDCVAFAPKLDNVKDYIKKGVPMKLIGFMRSRKEPISEGKYQTLWNFNVTSCEILNFNKKPEQQSKPTENAPVDDFGDTNFTEDFF